VDANGGFRCAPYGDARRDREDVTQGTEGLASDRAGRLLGGVLAIVIRGRRGRHGHRDPMVRSRFDSD
jgi:hypothetical protein